MLRRRFAAGFLAIEGFADRLVCVAGAVLCSQAPEFLQQYLQRLGGHLDEARRQLAAFEFAAHVAGKPWAQFLADTLANADAGVAQIGATMRDTAGRVETLAAAQQALTEASVWSRPFAFLGHFDWPIVRATLAVFKPAVPTTLEGGVYATVGVAGAFLLWHFLVRLPLRRVFVPKESVVAPVRR